ncbi:MAG: sel1 repeat family protein [Campylobacterales bacterium]|nr:sel1 repeat family protein [Campylobacterales bacterium]MBN2832286.1 sel1 repeat family protein [Campylobacterales bacterium]
MQIPSFEDLVGTIIISCAIYVFIRYRKLKEGIILILFGTILIGLSSFKNINVSIGGIKGINANFTTLIEEVQKTNQNTENLNLKLLKQQVSTIETHNAEFDEEKAREDIETLLDSSKITIAYQWKTKCEKLVKYSESYPLIIKKYKENQAEKTVETCIKAKEFNLDNLKYSFLLAIAYHRNQEYSMTIQILNELANNNYSIAQRKLGIMYLFGNLVQKDIKKAENWLIKSAENGDKAAQEILDKGLLY